MVCIYVYVQFKIKLKISIQQKLFKITFSCEKQQNTATYSTN